MIQTPNKAPRIRLAQPILRRLSMPRWSMLAWAILVRLLSLRGVLSLARFAQGLKSPGCPARDDAMGILRQAGKDHPRRSVLRRSVPPLTRLILPAQRPLPPSGALPNGEGPIRSFRPAPQTRVGCPAAHSGRHGRALWLAAKSARRAGG